MPLTEHREIEIEITTLLRQLIQIDTSNPPGNETAAARYLAKCLAGDGFDCEIIEPEAGRGSLITRLKGSGGKPRLLLLSHLDVVPANPLGWSVPPFEGVVKDGNVWGRGALDMKGMTAMEVMALKLLKRSNLVPKGDVILAATADEEMGGLGGASYLLRNHYDKIFAEYVVNEGGGSSIPVRGKNVFTIDAAERGLLWLKVTVKGTPGHGSTPDAADNPIMRLNKVVEKLGSYTAKVELAPIVQQFISQLATEDAGLDQPLRKILAHPEQSAEILRELQKTSPAVADEIVPRLKMTITPTMISGGNKENVIPSECFAVFDCRLLPGQSIEEAQAVIRGLLMDVGLDKLEFEVVQAQEPSVSPVETLLFDVMSDVLRDFEPNCGVTPILMISGSDSRFFRRMGSVCYGFMPMRSETKYGERVTRREHGVDERISIENLVFGASVLYETVKRFMT